MSFFAKFFLAFLCILIIFRLGFFYFFPLQLQDREHVTFQTVLLEDPKIIGNNEEFHVRFGTIWRSSYLLVETKADESFSYGQTLYVVGTVREKLLKNKQTVMTIQNPQIKAKNEGFLPLFGLLRQKIIDFCENNFSQPYSGLVVGIIFGVKSLLTDEITRSFRITGLSHIVAASGMNVTLVAGFLFGLFFGVLRRRGAVVSSLMGIFVYVCLSGFQASILRAALMGAVAFSAGLFGRQYSGIYTLFLVGTCMLLWDPILVTDVGFQLSILATAGIVMIKPFLFGSTIIGDDFGTTLAAQIATLPVIFATFGQYSLTSILANILVLWTIPFIMTVGGIGILVGLIFEPLGRIIVICILPLLWYLQEITGFFSSHAFILHTTNFPPLLLVGYYLIVVSLLLFLRRGRQ